MLQKKAQSYGTSYKTGNILCRTAAKSRMADTGIRGHRNGHADTVPPVRGLPARDTGRTQSLYCLLPVCQPGRRNTFLQGTKAADSKQNHLLQLCLQD